ncbi:MAG: DinB family protein [Rhodothermales bacterium]|nr:DinB family protein [Rhodothermales bacterium]
MHQSLKPLVEIVLFNNALFKACTGDISETESIEKPSENTNSLKWILGHVVTGRFVLGELCGMKKDLPWDGMFMAATDNEDLPALPEIVATFDKMTPQLMRAMAVLDEKALQTAPSSAFPTAEKTTLAALAFLLQHESYHLGQISYIRRFLDKMGLVDKLLSA